MARVSWGALLAAVLVAGPAYSNELERRDARRLTLRIYNYAGVAEDIQRDAQRETQRIFERFGIETAWLDCPTSPEEMAGNRTCAGAPGPNHLIMNLLPRSMSKRFGFQRGVFGFALPTPAGRVANTVSLFVQRVLDLAYYSSVGSSFEDAQAIILGHMMAHEAGHLLLGPGSHAAKGVMSFPWNEQTLEDMERGRLHFSPEERGRIRAELVRRVEYADD